MKKILTAFLALLLCITPIAMLSGCDVTTDTKEAIDTATSILPVEYSQSLAQGILANACATSINEKSIKSDYLMETYSFAGFKADPDLAYSSIYIDDNGKITEKMEITEGGEFIGTAYAISIEQADLSYKYYSLQNFGDLKEYCEIKRNTYGGFNTQNNSSWSSVYGGKMNLAGLIIKSSDDAIIEVESMFEYVIGGRYFAGKTYINARYEYSGAWGDEHSEKRGFDIEYVIEDNKISSIRILQRIETYSKGQDGVANTADDVLNAKWNVVETFNYEYTNQTEIYAPTSIDGYEYNEASAIAISQ